MNEILVVDDSASMRQLVSATLKQAGYEVTEAEDGEKALAIAQNKPFRLVLTDVNMPLMDGITLVGKLRGLSTFKFTPILVLTTEVDPTKKSKAKAAGATGWLVKPFDPQKLLATISRVLN